MPLPTPNAKESKEAFISRCVHILAHEDAGNRWPKNDQRLAVCYLQWDKKDESVEYSYLDPEHYASSLDDKLSRYLTMEDGNTTTTSMPDPEVAIPFKTKGKPYYNPISKVQKRKKIKKNVMSEIDSFLQKATSNYIIENKVSTEEILIALGGPVYFKKNFKTAEAAYKFVEKNLNKISEVLDIKVKDFPSRAIKSALSKIIKEKR